MKQYAVLFVVVSVVKLSYGGDNCDKLGILVYEDMGCKANYEHHDTCPSSFDCKGLQFNTNECYFRDHTYKPGDGLRDKGPICDLGCFCNPRSNASDFSCAQFLCAAFGPPTLAPNCYRTNKLRQCCPDEPKCVKPGEEIPKCLVDGVEYREGELFFPKDTCYRCVCQKGFSGKYEEPYCIRADCGVQVRHQNETQHRCAPFYYKLPDRYVPGVKCCPSAWVCPDGTEVIRPGKPGQGGGNKKCSFGDQSLNIGDWFTKDIQEYSRTRKAKCECRIPPLVTCEE